METNTRKIIARLERDGWIDDKGAKHHKYVHPDKPNLVIIFSRSGTQSTGVAKDIARKAGWTTRPN
jgi:predicted RNA binding protein YcfA (HicA-like mRNA interferase family)